MPYLELSLRCPARDEARYERALQGQGALSITLLDPHAGQADEQLILEPGVGETPLWPDCLIVALFDAAAPRPALLAALQSADPGLALGSASFREVADQDWVRAWLDQFQPLRFGRRTWVVPSEHALPAAARTIDAAVVRLDPGLAFGSGTHATTALCLEWLDGLDLAGKTVLDFGCGSGILALAALKLGATHAVAVDNDPQAILATADNARRNGVAARLLVCLPGEEPAARYPVVLANILANALEALAGALTQRVADGGQIVLSGILRGQETAVLERYAAGFEDFVVVEREGWVRISARRRHPPLHS